MALEQPKFEAQSGLSEEKEEQTVWLPEAVLSEKQREWVLRCVAEGDERTRNQYAIRQAELMAEVADITLSPETVAVYGVLRYEKPGEDDDYRKLSDQQLLAEALRLAGETVALEVFVKGYPHIFHE